MAVTAALALASAGCTGAIAGHATARVASAGPTGSSGAASSGASSGASGGASLPAPSGGASVPASTAGPSGSGSCPSTYARPDPDRPRVDLAFTVAAGLRSVTGTERIAFTPDRPITELVFRLTANTAPTVAEGNGIIVTSAAADHGAGRYTFSRAGTPASTQGGLLHIPFASTIAAGTTVTAHIAFRLTLGADSFDRFGTAGGFAYFGSAQPLLAWERGFGWHTEDMIQFPAESATSEAMQTELSVTAPAADTVIMSGDPADPPVAGATRTWHSTVAAARDVSVAVGPFVVGDTQVGPVRLRLGAPSAGIRDDLLPQFRRSITELTKLFGPYPFPSLSVARLPAEGGGIEYPSSILMLNGTQTVAVHETAHQWFYAMVGDSQALHPWLDEAFAQYAEQLVDDHLEGPDVLNAPGRVDSSTESYGAAVGQYYFTTYDKGSAALEAARTAAGPAAWDAALRCYVARNAWRIVNPPDLAAALVRLPAAVGVLTKAGALP